MKIELNLNEGESGDWKVSTFSISYEQARNFNLRCIMNRNRRYIEPGVYYKLTYKGEVIMSNTPAEVNDHLPFIKKANGKVLIAGLGLGMVITELLKKPDVTKIVVVEKSTDVISLVSPSYTDKRVQIVNADIFEYKPTEHFDFAWFDIWESISAHSYEEMKKLHRKFARSVTFKDSWCRYEAKKAYFDSKDYKSWAGITMGW